MARYLLLHAFPFDGSMWDAVGTRLGEHGHEVIAPDLRGFGSAPLGQGRPDIELLADDALASLGDRAAVVVGCSMGGYVALALARRRPDLVAGLGLVDTKATPDDAAGRARRKRVAELAEAGGDWSAGMIDGLLGQSTRRMRPDLVTAVATALACAPRDAVAWAQRAMAQRADQRDALATLTAPVVVVMGEEDTMSPLAEQRLMLDAAPQATWAAIPGAGHLTPLESPEAVAAELLGLVASGSSAG